MTTSHEIPTLLTERGLAERNYDVVIGLDEVGRGALAGPVMVGAVAVRSARLSDLDIIAGVADSKLLSANRREAMLGDLEEWSDAWAVGAASNTEIDEFGIMHALGMAALRALTDVQAHMAFDARASRPSICAILDGPYDYITKVVDSFDAPELQYPVDVITQIKADQHCATVSSASVIAKVTRDHMMTSLARSEEAYAAYGWDRNKGYGSAAHREAIARLGPSPLHRVSWHLS
ncbi:ribonuclease HII [Bifidobacterium psychraerophilum]|jgi:ribonuclease HII|uniref:ribonuclease HII n=1 Tax=Bifidobacterium psychraerophilum TaxID=218140 RepID=UPI0023F05A6D|nr:ribonuclease HII [Bifidobacterium psychraerophilum]MCI1660902.1 ribonuclease HII [Bifidobacterium psychraerophilum]MCI1805385.1 ribonuclease HII [Bifidobacterium psychraerophilum]MCI2177355.1 ribonuclease HII [Bifidobacterium psychraerophilum]MCI2182904.1 ribonuclease HII [Bifidobacterium psychraerophilum]